MTEAPALSPPVPHPEVETAFVGNEAVLLKTEAAAVYALNPSASAVWLLLDGARSATAIAEELADIFGHPVDVLLPDVERAIDEFAAQTLLKTASVVDDARAQRRVLHPPPDP